MFSIYRIKNKLHYIINKWFKNLNKKMSNHPQLGGPNNPANKRKLIES